MAYLNYHFISTLVNPLILKRLKIHRINGCCINKVLLTYIHYLHSYLQNKNKARTTEVDTALAGRSQTHLVYKAW